MKTWLMLEHCNHDAKVGVQALRNRIQSTKSSEFQHNMPMILEHIKMTMKQIEDVGETHYSFLKDTFDTMLTAPHE